MVDATPSMKLPQTSGPHPTIHMPPTPLPGAQQWQNPVLPEFSSGPLGGVGGMPQPQGPSTMLYCQDWADTAAPEACP